MCVYIHIYIHINIYNMVLKMISVFSFDISQKALKERIKGVEFNFPRF